MMGMKMLTRRQFLTISASALATTALAACGATPTATPVPPTATKPPAAAPAATSAPATATKPPAAAATTAPAAAAQSRFSEAPMLSDLVKAGKLPPVDQRLPKNPKIANETPTKWMKADVGKYGGTLRMVTPDVDNDPDTYMMCAEPILNSPGINEPPTPQLVETFSVSPDGKEWTFKLREGLRWSDGNPVTTDDVAFAINDVMFNKELTPTVPTWLKSGNSPSGAPMTFEVVDKWTYKVKFASAYAGFDWMVAFSSWRGYSEFIKPKHYLSQFHKTYTPEDKLKPLWEDAKLKDWIQLFTLKDVNDTSRQINWKKALGFPRLHAWLLVSADAQTYTYERNPYYHKIDAAGNQLPYIDKIVSTLVPDLEAINLRIISGQVDLSRRFPTVAKIPLYKENETKGGFKTAILANNISTGDLMLNLTHKDPVWRQVVQDKRFRQALAFAINRKELIDTVYYGFAKVADWIPTEYSLDKANKMLDDVGLNKKDADGHRLGPDGKVFTIPIEFSPFATDAQPASEMFVKFWEKVGIKTTMKQIDTALWTQRVAANDLYATLFKTDGFNYHYQEIGIARWAPLWQKWWDTGTKDGEEPPADAKLFMETWYGTSTKPVKEAEADLAKCKQMMTDNVYFFLSIQTQSPLIYNAKLGNVCDNPEIWTIAANFTAEQMYYKS
jgi:peptide/nickel transport system substrate-binding protein